MFNGLRIQGAMRCQLRHLGERNVLKDHVFINHVAIELILSLASGGNARRLSAPASASPMSFSSWQ
jgi:hypothetical protein